MGLGDTCPEWQSGKAAETRVNVALVATGVLGALALTSVFFTDFSKSRTSPTMRAAKGPHSLGDLVVQSGPTWGGWTAGVGGRF